MASRKPLVGMCEEHARYKDICVPCAEVRGAARALRALARWAYVDAYNHGGAEADGMDTVRCEALRRARKLEGKR